MQALRDENVPVNLQSNSGAIDARAVREYIQSEVKRHALKAEAETNGLQSKKNFSHPSILPLFQNHARLQKRVQAGMFVARELQDKMASLERNHKMELETMKMQQEFLCEKIASLQNQVDMHRHQTEQILQEKTHWKSVFGTFFWDFMKLIRLA